MNKKVDEKKELDSKEIKKKDSQFKKKKKIKRNITSGIAFVNSTFNNFFRSLFNFLVLIFNLINFCHNYFLSGVNFFPAIAIALPFLVLALHLVL